MKTILVPTDFSKNAENALLYAVDIAKREKAKIFLAHAFQINYSNSAVPYFEIKEEIERLSIESETKLGELALNFLHNQVPFETYSVQDFPVDTVVRLATEKDIDLIVMGTKGANGLIGNLMGSNTAKVIELVKCPVLAIPEESTFREITKITYATSYVKNDFDSLNKVIEIAAPYLAHLNIIHISDGTRTEAEENALMEIFIHNSKTKAPYDKISFEIIKDKDTEHALQNFIVNDATGLLVMSTHHRDFLDKIFGKSYTQRMANHTKIPLLAFHH